MLQQSSKHYKKTMNKFIRQYNKQKEKKLRNLQSKNPKEYWKFLNSLKTRHSLAGPKLEEFYEHFKLLNENDNEYGEILILILTTMRKF